MDNFKKRNIKAYNKAAPSSRSATLDVPSKSIPPFPTKNNKSDIEIDGKNSKGNKKFSLSKDSHDNKLSPDQQEFFKDSKLVDKDGNLLAIYHGIPKDKKKNYLK